MNSFSGWVKPEIITTGVPTAHASHDSPLDNPTKNSACLSHRALLQRLVAGLVFGAVGNVVPDQAGTVRRFLVDADHTITGLSFRSRTISCQPWGLFQYLA